MEDWIAIGQTAINADSMNPFSYAPKDKDFYGKSWEAIRKYQIETLFPNFIKGSIGNQAIPAQAKTWLENYLKIYFASQCIIPYTRVAEILDMTMLVARLEKKEKAELRNMTDEAFDLKKFIDENYKGRPVVVDLWNTWCGPCMEAISQSEETKQEFAGSDLVFLYVADDSSPEDEWSRKAEEIGSKQVRVSTDTSAAILKSHNLEGFPSYLFFDRNHNLIHSRTAFPGTRRFRELLLELNPRK